MDTADPFSADPTAADAAPAEEVDLVVLVRKAAAEHAEEPAPARLVDTVLSGIPAGSERPLLARLLPRFVTDTLRRLEQVTATDPATAWTDLLHERVPTPAGYRFLRDCTVDDIVAGARRRREHAEALVRRAELYEAVAAHLNAGTSPSSHPEPSRPEHGAPTEADHPSLGTGATVPASRPAAEPESPGHETADTPGDLPVRTGVGIVVQARGYVAPGGRTFRELPPGMRPTINQILDELAMLPADVLAAQLRNDDELTEKVALAEARGWAHPELTQMLESPDLLDNFYDALGRLRANLAATAGRMRSAGDERGRRRVGRDQMAVQERQAAARRLLTQRAGTRPVRKSPEDRARQDALRALLTAHHDEFRGELTGRLTAAGLPEEPDLRLPPKERAWEVAHAHGWVETDDDVEALSSLDDAAFALVVRGDINDDRVTQLRDPQLLPRWQATLDQISADHLSLPPPDDDDRRIRRARFHEALMARQSEARRALATYQRYVHALVDQHNQAPERAAILDATKQWLVDQYPEEYAALTHTARADRGP